LQCLYFSLSVFQDNQSCNPGSETEVSRVVAMLDTLLADMENFSGDSNYEKKAEDLESKVDLLTEKLKQAFDPETDMTNFRWSLSDEETKKIGYCSGCNKEMGDKSVLVGDESYHEECFVCFHCGDRLKGKYYQIDGHNYCENDRKEAVPSCHSCQLPLLSGSFTVNGLKFHPDCFTCSVCGNVIMGKFITTEDGKYICEHDFKQSKEKCAECGLPMLEKVLTAMEKKFHPACFRCSQCEYGMDGKQFMVEDGAVFCPECYSKYKGLQCRRCSKNIVTESSNNTTIITCQENNYHDTCYTCKVCDNTLIGQHVFRHPEEDEVICGECNNM